MLPGPPRRHPGLMFKCSAVTQGRAWSPAARVTQMRPQVSASTSPPVAGGCHLLCTLAVNVGSADPQQRGEPVFWDQQAGRAPCVALCNTTVAIVVTCQHRVPAWHRARCRAQGWVALGRVLWPGSRASWGSEPAAGGPNLKITSLLCRDQTVIKGGSRARQHPAW